MSDSLPAVSARVRVGSSYAVGTQRLFVGGTANAFGQILNEAGDPVQGEGVTFSWREPSGSALTINGVWDAAAQRYLCARELEVAGSWAVRMLCLEPQRQTDWRAFEVVETPGSAGAPSEALWLGSGESAIITGNGGVLNGVRIDQLPIMEALDGDEALVGNQGIDSDRRTRALPVSHLRADARAAAEEKTAEITPDLVGQSVTLQLQTLFPPVADEYLNAELPGLVSPIAIATVIGMGIGFLRGDVALTESRYLTFDDAWALLIYSGDTLLPLRLAKDLNFPGVVIVQRGAGQVQIVPDDGVTARSPTEGDATSGTGSYITLLRMGDNDFAIGGSPGVAGPPEAPRVIGGGIFSGQEGAEDGIFCGYVSITGSREGMVIEIDGPFAIDPLTYVITKKGTWDFETDPVLEPNVTATNVYGTDNGSITVNVLDDPPAALVAGQGLAAVDSKPIGTVIGKLAFTGKVTSFSVTGGPVAIAPDGTATTTDVLNAAITANYVLTVQPNGPENPSGVGASTVPFAVVAAGTAFTPITDGAAANWEPANAAFRTVSGSPVSFDSLRDVGGSGADFIAGSNTISSPRGLLLTGADGINSFDAIGFTGHYLLTVASGNAAKSLTRNRSYLGFGGVLWIDAPSASHLARWTINTSTTDLRFAPQVAVPQGDAVLLLNTRRADSTAVTGIYGSTIITPAQAHFFYYGLDLATGEVLLMLDLAEEFSTPFPGGETTTDSASNTVTLGATAAAATVSNVRMAGLFFRTTKPTQALLRKYAAIQLAKYRAA